MSIVPENELDAGLVALPSGILSSAVVEPFGFGRASKIGQTFGDDLVRFEHSSGNRLEFIIQKDISTTSIGESKSNMGIYT